MNDQDQECQHEKGICINTCVASKDKHVEHMIQALKYFANDENWQVTEQGPEVEGPGGRKHWTNHRLIGDFDGRILASAALDNRGHSLWGYADVPSPTQTALSPMDRAKAVVKQMDDDYFRFIPEDMSPFRTAAYDQYRADLIAGAIIDAVTSRAPTVAHPVCPYCHIPFTHYDCRGCKALVGIVDSSTAPAVFSPEAQRLLGDCNQLIETGIKSYCEHDEGTDVGKAGDVRCIRCNALLEIESPREATRPGGNKDG